MHFSQLLDHDEHNTTVGNKQIPNIHGATSLRPHCPSQATPSGNSGDIKIPVFSDRGIWPVLATVRTPNL